MYVNEKLCVKQATKKGYTELDDRERELSVTLVILTVKRGEAECKVEEIYALQ